MHGVISVYIEARLIAASCAMTNQPYFSVVPDTNLACLIYLRNNKYGAVRGQISQRQGEKDL